jgi:hypothetical protein
MSLWGVVLWLCALWSLVDVVWSVEDWGLTVADSGSFLEACTSVISALGDEWSREALLQMWGAYWMQIVASLYVMSAVNLPTVQRVGAAAREVLTMLAFVDMAHSVTEVAGVVTGGVIESWLTPVAAAVAFDVLAHRLASSLRRLVSAMEPGLLAAQIRDAGPPPPQQGGGAAGGGAAGPWGQQPAEQGQAGQDEQQPFFANLEQGAQPNVIPGLGVAPGDQAVRAGQAEAERIAAGGAPNVGGPQPSGNYNYY